MWSDVIEGIEWVIAKARIEKIRVLNLSLGHPVTESYRTDPLCRAVERALITHGHSDHARRNVLAGRGGRCDECVVSAHQLDNQRRDVFSKAIP